MNTHHGAPPALVHRFASLPVPSVPPRGAGAGGAADSHLLLPAPPAPPPPGLHAPQPESLLQAEYRLCNGSDRECVSPTAKVSKKEALKVGLGPGRGRGPHLLDKGAPGPVRPAPASSLPRGGGRTAPQPPHAPASCPLPGPILVPQLDARGWEPRGRASPGPSPLTPHCALGPGAEGDLPPGEEACHEAAAQRPDGPQCGHHGRQPQGECRPRLGPGCFGGPPQGRHRLTSPSGDGWAWGPRQAVATSWGGPDQGPRAGDL